MATGTGEAGTVMSMICTLPSSSYLAVTTAYVLPDISAMATPLVPSSAVNPSAPSVAVATGTGEAGTVMSMICMPS